MYIEVETLGYSMGSKVKDESSRFPEASNLKRRIPAECGIRVTKVTKQSPVSAAVALTVPTGAGIWLTPTQFLCIYWRIPTYPRRNRGTRTPDVLRTAVSWQQLARGQSGLGRSVKLFFTVGGQLRLVCPERIKSCVVTQCARI